MSEQRLRVLVADDTRVIHALFAGLADRSPIPFEVLSAYDGRECMDRLVNEPIDLAFIDVNMPEMSGMDAVDNARQVGNKTFITLMSASASTRRQQLAKRLRVYEFLAKPFLDEDVTRILQTYCRITRPVRTLIVDDSATVRRIILKVLDNSIFNIETLEAGDGEAALALTDSGHFDVAFLDCNMPGLNGEQTLQRLLNRHPEIRVIMISGERNEERRQSTLASGATAFLYKPFTAHDIDRVLHQIFDLAMPSLASIEPMRFAREAPAIEETARLDWGSRAEAAESVRR